MQLTGHITDYFVAFAAGAAVSFTPCAYPIIPITAGIIGGVNTRGTKLMGFICSLIYVLGLAISYSFLGLIAILTGKAFGQFQNSPWVFLIVGNLLILFALVLFDFISIPFLGFQFNSKIKARNMWSLLFLGMAAGFIVGPCTAPILATLLLYIGSKQNLIYGLSLLFVFSYGVGASLILVGTFSGLLSNLPKSGAWLNVIKKTCGLILFIAGEYYIIQAGRLFL